MGKKTHKSSKKEAYPSGGEQQQPSSSISGAAAAAKKSSIWASRFKTKICEKFSESGDCPYGHRCMFAHSGEEIRTKEMNFDDGLTTEERIKKFQYNTHQQALQATRQLQQQKPQSRQGSSVTPSHISSKNCSESSLNSLRKGRHPLSPVTVTIGRPVGAGSPLLSPPPASLPPTAVQSDARPCQSGSFDNNNRLASSGRSQEDSLTSSLSQFHPNEPTLMSSASTHVVPPGPAMVGGGPQVSTQVREQTKQLVPQQVMSTPNSDSPHWLHQPAQGSAPNQQAQGRAPNQQGQFNQAGPPGNSQIHRQPQKQQLATSEYQQQQQPQPFPQQQQQQHRDIAAQQWQRQQLYQQQQQQQQQGWSSNQYPQAYDPNAV